MYTIGLLLFLCDNNDNNNDYYCCRADDNPKPDAKAFVLRCSCIGGFFNRFGNRFLDGSFNGFFGGSLNGFFGGSFIGFFNRFLDHNARFLGLLGNFGVGNESELTDGNCRARNRVYLNCGEGDLAVNDKVAGECSVFEEHGGVNEIGKLNYALVVACKEVAAAAIVENAAERVVCDRISNGGAEAVGKGEVDVGSAGGNREIVNEGVILYAYGDDFVIVVEIFGTGPNAFGRENSRAVYIFDFNVVALTSGLYPIVNGVLGRDEAIGAFFCTCGYSEASANENKRYEKCDYAFHK